MTQPIYQYPPQAPAPFVDPTPELKRQSRIITFLSALVAVSVLLNVFLAYLILNSGTIVTPLGYKEYSSLAEVYRSAALGERVKVTVTSYQPDSVSTGFITLADSDRVGVILRIPATLKGQIKAYYGRNIVYGQITERNGPSLYIDVAKVEP